MHCAINGGHKSYIDLGWRIHQIVHSGVELQKKRLMNEKQTNYRSIKLNDSIAVFSQTPPSNPEIWIGGDLFSFCKLPPVQDRFICYYKTAYRVCITQPNYVYT